MTGNCDAMNHLLDLNADPNALDLSSCRTPLFYAVENHDLDASRVLIANGSDVDTFDSTGRGLSHALVLGGDHSPAAATGILGLLKQRGADVNQLVEAEGSTPLHVASEGAMPGMIRILVDHGGEVRMAWKGY